MARVLVIDDDVAVRATIEAMLRSAGHDAVIAANGEEGIERFRQSPCDLVLCDIFMPKMSGIGTLRALREINRRVPVIMMSGGAPGRWQMSRSEFIDYLELSRMYGATATIAKPFKAVELLGVVDQALQSGA